MRVFDRLRLRLQQEHPELGVQDDDVFSRCYPGYAQRLEGFWVWTCHRLLIGSSETASALLKARRLIIMPEPYWPINDHIHIHTASTRNPQFTA
jgi:hypothetical protein